MTEPQLGVPHVIVRTVGWDDPGAVALRTAQRAEIDSRYGPDSEPGVAPSAADVAHFVVADLAGEPVACGGLRRIDATTGEIKRMYATPAVRGHGAAAAVLAALETEARALGWTRLWLETGRRQPDAIAFYVKHNYAPIPPFGHYTEPASLCFGRELD